MANPEGQEQTESALELARKHVMRAERADLWLAAVQYEMALEEMGKCGCHQCTLRQKKTLDAAREEMMVEHHRQNLQKEMDHEEIWLMNQAIKKLGDGETPKKEQDERET